MAAAQYTHRNADLRGRILRADHAFLEDFQRINCSASGRPMMTWKLLFKRLLNLPNIAPTSNPGPSILSDSVRGSDTVFHTPRCVVRPWHLADAPRFLDTYRRWEVAQWLGTHPKPVETLDEAEARITAWTEHNHAAALGTYSDVIEGEAVAPELSLH